MLTAETLRTDLLDLWHDGRMPIKSILMVTHNIEEAVLMSDRILVLSSNPGRIASEISVTIPQPRDRLDPDFRALVDKIYALMTQRPDPTETACPGDLVGAWRCPCRSSRPTRSPACSRRLRRRLTTARPTCRTSPNSLALEIDDLFPLGETLQLLKLAEFEEGDIKLTPLGQRFVDMDVDQRKKVFGEQLLANIPLASHIKRVLDERPSHRAPATRFREELEDYMSEDYAERTLPRDHQSRPLWRAFCL